MDNKAIAGILYETADLLEIDGQDSFRIRSYRNAAQAIEALPQQISESISEPKKILEIPGIGKGMLNNLQEMLREGRLSLHAELLNKYRPSMLQLLKVQGLGPKTIALIWSAYQVCDLEGVEQLAREGKIRILPRMGEKHEQKLLKAIEDYRRIAGGTQVDVRFLAPESCGAAMQYFTGSKAHNVSLRQRALKMGYTLNEYSLARLDDQQVVASKTEEEIYAALKLDYIPPEMRE